ncbi:MAG: MotA/TolQ/ExbB proton channel family protein [Bacteroidia bacterium]
MLSKNLVIISTIASIATLLGLLGTVIGMIRAFSALATTGAPDAVALSTGISEALNNTALGIGTSAIAIAMYNFFTSRIDNITYGIDEAGYSIVQSFASRYKCLIKHTFLYGIRELVNSIFNKAMPKKLKVPKKVPHSRHDADG